MTRQEKEAYVVALADQLGSRKPVVMTQFRGTTVGELESLRRQFHELGMSYRVAKNSLLRRALVQAGIALDDPGLLDKPLALATGGPDEIALAKAVAAINKTVTTVIPVGGIIEGQFVPLSLIAALAKLPSRQELYGRVIGSLGGLTTRLVQALAGPVRSLELALGQIQAQRKA